MKNKKTTTNKKENKEEKKEKERKWGVMETDRQRQERKVRRGYATWGEGGRGM